MSRPIVILTLLALIWGASFMLIKIADRQLTPATLVLGRLGSATLLLAAIAAVRLGLRRTLAEIRSAWLWLVVVGLVNPAIRSGSSPGARRGSTRASPRSSREPSR